jgi:hypothetical protein
MSEAAMRKKVVQALKPLHGIAVENPCLPGTPDVNYIEGWVELKWLRSWPKGADTVVRFDHYTVQQKVWAYMRRRAGGQAWFLIQCGREWILLDGAVAAMHVNKATKAELISVATAYFDAGLQPDDLVQLLQQQQPAFRPTADEIARLKETT